MKKAPPAPKTSAAKKSPVRKTAAKKPAPKKTAAPKPARAKKPADPQRQLVEKVRGILDGKKGENVVVLHVADVSSVTDYMILCTGLNIPHLRGLADEVAKQLRLETPPVACHRRAGSAESEWFVLDYIDFVVHLFTPSMRGYYAIEQLWKDAPVVS
jgi:ribosome-associated protein